MKFNRLKFIKFTGKKSGSLKYAEFLCDCGKIHVADFYQVKYGRMKSCGCHRRDRMRELNKVHEPNQQRAYQIWNAMKGRCFVKSNSMYFRYGGSGITMCERWRESFSNFFDDMGEP